MLPAPTFFSLQCTKARLKVTEKELKALQWEHEVLEQRFVQVSGPQAGLQAQRGPPWCLPVCFSKAFTPGRASGFGSGRPHHLPLCPQDAEACGTSCRWPGVSDGLPGGEQVAHPLRVMEVASFLPRTRF